MAIDPIHFKNFTLIWIPYTVVPATDRLLGYWVAARIDTETRFYSVAGGNEVYRLGKGHIVNTNFHNCYLSIFTSEKDLNDHRYKALERLKDEINDYISEGKESSL